MLRDDVCPHCGSENYTVKELENCMDFLDVTEFYHLCLCEGCHQHFTKYSQIERYKEESE